MPPVSSFDDQNPPEVSVVIPFRNRDLSRLDLAISSLFSAADGLSMEILVSDFGSDDVEGIRSVCDRHGARLVRTEADRWSRSACLNRGITQARGRFIQCDDADMIWAPKSLTRHVKSLESRPGGFVNFQVWDLPPSLTDSLLTGREPNWDLLRQEAHAHSRWGHGLILAPTAAFSRVGGFDERMHTYGLEDLDLTKRLRLAGWRQQWAGNDGDELFHIWHPRVPDQLKKDASIAAIVDANRKLYRNDDSIVRNRERVEKSSLPLVSVVIATRDRKNHLLEAIQSCFYQTVQNFEIIVVDDGSIDGTGEVIADLGDSRIKYVWQEPAGISAARNHGTKLAKGFYIAVLDDDDLMLPDRLEVQLRALTGTYRACVGNMLNFDDTNGELETWADTAPTLIDALARGGFAAHPSWLIERSVLEAIPYDESLTSAVDNNQALRALRSGVKFTHCRTVVTLRRRHQLQVTATDSGNQKKGATLTHLWYRSAVNQTTRKKSLSEVDKNVQRADENDSLRPRHESWLPDHLVDRSIDVYVDRPLWDSDDLPGVVDDDYFVVLDRDGGHVGNPLRLDHVTWADLVDLRERGVDHRVVDVQFKTLTGSLGDETSRHGSTPGPQASEPGWTAFHQTVEHQIMKVRDSLTEKQFLVTWLTPYGDQEQPSDGLVATDRVETFDIIGRRHRSELNILRLDSATEVLREITKRHGLMKIYIRRAPLALKTLMQFVAKEDKEGERKQ